MALRSQGGAHGVGHARAVLDDENPHAGTIAVRHAVRRPGARRSRLPFSTTTVPDSSWLEAPSPRATHAVQKPCVRARLAFPPARTFIGMALRGGPSRRRQRVRRPGGIAAGFRRFEQRRRRGRRGRVERQRLRHGPGFRRRRVRQWTGRRRGELPTRRGQFRRAGRRLRTIRPAAVLGDREGGPRQRSVLFHRGPRLGSGEERPLLHGHQRASERKGGRRRLPTHVARHD